MEVPPKYRFVALTQEQLAPALLINNAKAANRILGLMNFPCKHVKAAFLKAMERTLQIPNVYECAAMEELNRIVRRSIVGWTVVRAGEEMLEQIVDQTSGERIVLMTISILMSSYKVQPKDEVVDLADLPKLKKVFHPSILPQVGAAEVEEMDGQRRVEEGA